MDGRSLADAADAAPAAKAASSAPAQNAETDDQTILFEADEITRDSESSPIVASGHVTAFAAGRHLRADRISYDPETAIIVAEGNVSITDTTEGKPQTAFAGKVQLSGDLRDSIAEHFSALLNEGSRLAGYDATRVQDSRTNLRRGVYTTCNVCTQAGAKHTPTWRIKALRVTRDEERKVVRFRSALFEVKGVPIFYFPYLQAADPSLERASGFLTPKVSTSSRLGFNFELPYYFAFSNHFDATLSPKYTSRDGVLWQTEVRQRGRHGEHVWQAGVINFDTTKLDATGNLPVGVPGVRWHFFGAGSRTFGDNLRIAYDVERVSDDTYFRQYNIRRVGELRQEIDTVSTLRLRSNINAVWKSGGSELRVDSFLFQGLRATDNSRLTPYVLPLIDFKHDFGDDVLGGRATFGANFASLQRTGGADTRRLTLDATWERDVVTTSGHKFAFTADLRGDGYRYADLNEGTETVAADPTAPRRSLLRFAPTAAADWTYPLTRRFAGAQIIVEPRVQIAVSPANRNPASVLNEDSQSVEFDYSSLFEYNKSTGYDRFEDGQRINAGLVTSASFDNGFALESSLGRQYRLQNTNAFNLGSGLGDKKSDFVGEFKLRYKAALNLENRFRYNPQSNQFSRVESNLNFNAWRVGGQVYYTRLNEENVATELSRREEVSGSLHYQVARHWNAGVGGRRNLVTNQWINQDIVIGYSDECASISLTYRRDFTRDIGLPANTSFLIRFTLKGLVE